MRVGTEKSMNNTKKLRSALLSSLTIIASIVLGHTAQAASLYFRAAGTKLDNDDILDINVTGKKEIEFTIFINTSELDDSVKSFNYNVEFDSQELQFDNIRGFVSHRGDFKIQEKNIRSFRVSNENPLNPTIPRKPPALPTLITVIRFKVIGKPPSDGEFDFKISDAGGKFNNDNDIPSVFKYGVTLPELGVVEDNFSQQVEVQEGGVPGTPEPTSILGLFSLGIIGVGATIKREVKRNHSIEKETTEIG